MVQQPYLYGQLEGSRTSIAYPYSDFNPRAATQAHYQAFAERAERQKKLSQQDGRPLINFNQHPDSYMVVNNPEVHHEPLPSNTKGKIIGTRWVQFAFRILQELGALGVLVCVICLKMANDGPGWIIRIAPAWDVVISMYAIYHLLRPAKGRTPNSSSSYHFFALFMDVGLIPFYVFIALYSNQNYNMQPTEKDRWTSFFNTNFATSTVIYVTFIASIVVGGLHLISVLLDIYLIIMFRKIANLPPDMNPLEDNLTGSSRRRSMKHKHKNSEMTISSVSSDMSEKKSGYYSGSTMNGSRSSMVKDPEARVIPWGHSRTDSNQAYSPHNPDSARFSKQQYDEVTYHPGPQSARSSRVSVAGSGHRSRAGTVVSPAEHGVPMYIEDVPPIPGYTDRPLANQGTPERYTSAPSRDAVRTQQKAGLLNDNWYVMPDADVADLGTPRTHASDRPFTAHSREPKLPNVELQRADSFEPQQQQVQPLKMNPPTPPVPESELGKALTQEDKENYDPTEIGVARQLTVASQGTVASSVYSESAPSLMTSSMVSGGRSKNNTPSRKQYGDLAAATRGVRGNQSGAFPHFKAPAQQKQGTRVISRTGADIADMNVFGSETQSRRRDVSGKIAEEGRGGWDYYDTTLASPPPTPPTTNEAVNERPPLNRTKSGRYYATRTKSVKERRDRRDQNGDTRSISYGQTGSAWHLILS
ncbi:hypothetical protein CB0940_03306 [Cercospora beticola]|uniref:Uncharacterized protein n=2 Tax=Cercospora beticola TaxID=122368 RepID=A0A2G5I4J0_CERBT|nr:hypothetical protein CB0940_03306 [Cercospora beticola]PIA99715.1 hypothetical protein CB0940_03306 [Cercospora beticola]WPB00481.1 hypothetical protein RHO25_005101 [Cercospora beticola]